ncbi:MAG: [FeFe] hydrogenase H-cluster radical SAM maturase HydE [Ruminococcaceae bacterium]|nr:[FeFe] hydrogenase H-cluster radical SAM maturase HydE [Oscillospiraceae bacterium]
MLSLIEKLEKERSLLESEYVYLLENRTPEISELLLKKATEARKRNYGIDIYVRGLIEFTNYCKNNCYYCGIRAGNKKAERYRLSEEEILSCCEYGYKIGMRTFVLQGGEDVYFTAERIENIIRQIKNTYPDCAVTLSFGEHPKETYQKWFDAGADRYLLRHETADDKHYALLHPSNLTLENRKKCLYDLKEIGYQVGCGFMVGSPFQTNFHLARDLKFIEEFKPQMVGIGPFIPHCDTPFSKEKGGSLEMTLFLLSVVRLILPNVLLPATTALGTISENGREKGILAGANVCMPNLSPKEVRHKYMLYNNKKSTGAESADEFQYLKERMEKIGYHVTVSRGDFKPDIL